jgi:cysteine desulfurase
VPLVHGGSQQQFRSGTQDAAGAHAFAVAARLAIERMDARNSRLGALADRLVAGLAASVPAAVLRGDPVDRLPGSIHFTVTGGDGDSLLFLLDRAGYSVSTGSACQAGVPELSHVLLAMGLTESDARGALRVTLGSTSTEQDVDGFVAALADATAPQ